MLTSTPTNTPTLYTLSHHLRVHTLGNVGLRAHTVWGTGRIVSISKDGFHEVEILTNLITQAAKARPISPTLTTTTTSTSASTTNTNGLTTNTQTSVAVILPAGSTSASSTPPQTDTANTNANPPSTATNTTAAPSVSTAAPTASSGGPPETVDANPSTEGSGSHAKTEQIEGEKTSSETHEGTDSNTEMVKVETHPPSSSSSLSSSSSSQAQTEGSMTTQTGEPTQVTIAGEAVSVAILKVEGQTGTEKPTPPVIATAPTVPSSTSASPSSTANTNRPPPPPPPPPKPMSNSSAVSPSQGLTQAAVVADAAARYGVVIDKASRRIAYVKAHELEIVPVAPGDIADTPYGSGLVTHYNDSNCIYTIHVSYGIVYAHSSIVTRSQTKENDKGCVIV